MEVLAVEILRTFGIVTLCLLAIALVAGKLLGDWLAAKVQAQVSVKVEEALAKHQHELDKALDDHRQALELAAESVRLNHQRILHDFTLYAERRHQAAADVFRGFLDTEAGIVDMSPYVAPDPETQPRSDTIAFLQRLGVAERDWQAISDLWDSQGGAAVRRRVHELADAARIKQATALRNAAYDLFHRNALYLTESVERAANEVVEAVHMCLVSHIQPRESLGADMLYYRLKLRGLMLDLKHVIRADLGRSAEVGQLRAEAPA